jgi:UDP-GlcNAc:undecaprenyl-phosphate GlcNAc-1-phosphate transferase
VSGYAAVFAVATLVTFFLTPRVRRFAESRGVVQPPDERRAHPRPTAALGGVAMFGGFIAALLVASVIPQFRHTVFADPREVIGIAVGATFIWGVGVADDIKPVSPPAKMAGMFVASGLLVLAGVTMFYFRVPVLGFLVLSPDMLPLITTIWVILLANAVNLIDGLDGLAAGIVAIGSAALFLYGTQLFDAGLLTADNPGPLVAAIACGVCVGFLPANRHPASIFMGDGGALFLGLLMAVFYFPLFTPLLILGVPVLDTALAFARRTVRGRSFAGADRRHVHYRLLEMGHGHRRVVFILWIWTAIL